MENSRQKSRPSAHNGTYFVASFAAAVLLTWLIQGPGFTEAQVLVLFLLIFSVGLWLTEAVPPFAVGLFIMAFLVFTLGYKGFAAHPQDASLYVTTFSSSVIWLMLGGFFLASAMTKTRLDADLIRITLHVSGSKPKWILFGMMSVTMTASLLISNTATTAMVIAALMPLLKELGKHSKVGKGLLLGIPIAATTGGMGTLIGTPPNAIATGALHGAGESMDFVKWMLFGLPVSLVMTFIAWIVLVRLFMKDAQPVTMKDPTAGIHNPVVKRQRYVVMGVLIVTVGLWLTTPLHEMSSALVSAVPLVALTLSRVLTGEDVRHIGWDTLLLVAGGLSLGTGLEQTGLLQLYAGRIASLSVPPVVFYFVLAYATMIFSNIMSNTATSTVLIPLGMAILPDNKVEVAMIIGLCASTALFLPVSTPPNAIVYSTGLIEQKDLRIGGLLIGLLGPAAIILWVLLVA